MKIYKLYIVGLFASLVLLTIRVFFVLDDLISWIIVWRIVKTIFFIHFVGLLGYGIMKLHRIIFQRFFANLFIVFLWIAILVLTIQSLRFYITEINNSDLDFSQVNAIFMLLVGGLIENLYQHQILSKERVEKEKENSLPEDMYEKNLITGKKVS